ncbi:MAG: hypothetical protein MK137_03840 [Rickettsiales bacterium]|nr:hypothetical protein [Rickettsiales bacterium]
MFSNRRRGRPKANIPAVDYGTPELAAKRMYDCTKEPLDVLKDKGLISDKEHEAGMRFRCLHYVFFGSPTATAYHPEHHQGGRFYVQELRSQEWLNKKNVIYKRIASALREQGVFKDISDLCVYQKRPKILDQQPTGLNAQSICLSEKYTNELVKIKQGLGVLDRYFQRNIQ